ncbi:MAG: hypothetical protein ACOYIB_03330 [Desulfosporosinus sp.]|jgi:hypothetical protein
MLNKLLKYELKATGRIFLPLFLALLLFAAITRLISAISPEEWVTPAIISMIIYIVIMVGMFVMTLIMMIQRFYQNLLTNEGYLMFTLPVKPWTHIVSKLLVSMFWIITSGIVAMISILIIALERGDLTEIIQGFASVYNHVFDVLGADLYLLSLEVFMITLISIASGILFVYVSMAIGHLFSQHKILASFGAFIVLSALSQIFFLLVSLIPGSTEYINFHIVSANGLSGLQQATQQAIVYAIFFESLLCAAYFAVTNYILSKRLNLE